MNAFWCQSWFTNWLVLSPFSVWETDYTHATYIVGTGEINKLTFLKSQVSTGSWQRIGSLSVLCSSYVHEWQCVNDVITNRIRSCGWVGGWQLCEGLGYLTFWLKVQLWQEQPLTVFGRGLGDKCRAKQSTLQGLVWWPELSHTHTHTETMQIMGVPADYCSASATPTNTCPTHTQTYELILSKSHVRHIFIDSVTISNQMNKTVFLVMYL